MTTLDAAHIALAVVCLVTLIIAFAFVFRDARVIARQSRNDRADRATAVMRVLYSRMQKYEWTVIYGKFNALGLSPDEIAQACDLFTEFAVEDMERDVAAKAEATP